MGLPVRQEHFEPDDYARFAERLDQDLEALGRLLARPGFGEGPPSLGAEIELSLIDANARAFNVARDVLADSLDPQLQLELDRFNLEYNLTPVATAGRPLGALEDELTRALARVDGVAALHGGRAIAIGILPTLTLDDLKGSVMTDLPRYRALTRAIRGLRGGPVRVRIGGADPLDLSCDDVTLEGANTSFQVHLRVAPHEFAATYNAAQIVTPIAMAAAANSPFFLGHRLWDETRVALFQQVIDTRAAAQRAAQQPARVSFGQGWVRDGAFELFAENVALHQPLLPVVGPGNPLGVIEAGGLPSLAELRLHQGTVWHWNRAIYDPGAGGHLRIELRTLPGGPTPADMIANAAFLVGLTVGLRDGLQELLPAFPFRYAEHNFVEAAQHGLDATLAWPTRKPPSPRTANARELAIELLDVARAGLSKLGIADADAEPRIALIEARLRADTNGARWQRRMLEGRTTRKERSDALAAIVDAYLREAAGGRPVHDWSEAR